MQKRITISFTKADEDIYKFLKAKPNISCFVCEVVRVSMSGDDLNTRIAGFVAKMLDKDGAVDCGEELRQLAEKFEF